MSFFCRSDRLTNRAGDGLANFKVRALDQDTGAVVPIFADENGTPLANNEAIVDDLGNYVYFIPHGTYSEEYLDPTGARAANGFKRYVNMGYQEEAVLAAAEAAATTATTKATEAAASEVAAVAAAANAQAAAAYGTRWAVANLTDASSVTAALNESLTVWSDATVANRGIYRCTAAPSTFTKIADLPTTTAAASAEAAAASASILTTETIAPFTINGTGSVVTADAVFYWASSITASDRWLTDLTVDVSTSGTFRVIVAKVNGDGSLDLYSNTGVALTTASKTATGLAIYVPATYVVGIQRGTGQMHFQSGTIPGSQTQWQTTAIPTTSTAKTTTTANGVKWHPTFTPEVTYKARVGYDVSAEVAGIVGETELFGWPETIVATGSNAPTNYSIVIQDPLGTGRISNIKLGANASGTAIFSIVTMSGLTVTVVSQVSYAVTAGVNSIPVNIVTAAGQYLAITLTGLKFQLNSNPTGQAVWARTGTLTTGNTLTSESAHRFEVIVTAKSGLVADVANSAVAVNDGGGLIAAADKNGVTDATSVFTTAKAAHPEPYIDPGTYAVTAVPARGGGLWGPGVVNVNGQRQFLPAAPRTLTLLEQLRAEMMEHICNNDVLTLIGDSIGQYVYPGSSGTRADHYLNRLTRFVNMGVALDDPGESALRPDTGAYVPSWNGITTSGTVSSGTNGPLGVSLVLAAGASITFTGAYESVAVHYQAAPGGGLLTYAYNASSFATTDANATAENDAFSGLKATGQTASGTYTITASGASVEITNLIRLGVRTAGPLNRLLTQRVARGGNTFSSYVAAARTNSILKIGSWAGGKAVPILALGINDSFTVPTATIVANATTIIDALVAGGVPRIYAIPPMRPTSAWDASYTGGRTFEPASAALRRLYRQRGVSVVPMDALDWNGEGLFNDGLHTGVAGNQVQAQILIEHLAGLR